MRPREKLVEAENIPREISYKIGHSQVSLCLPIRLKIYSNGYKSRFLPFSRFWQLFCEYLAMYMRPREKIVGVENGPREISYKVGHSRVSLDLPFNLEIHQIKKVKIEIFNFSHIFGNFFANISRSMRPRWFPSDLSCMKFHEERFRPWKFFL